MDNIKKKFDFYSYLLPFYPSAEAFGTLRSKRPISWVATYYTAHTPLRKKCQTYTFSLDSNYLRA